MDWLTLSLHAAPCLKLATSAILGTFSAPTPSLTTSHFCHSQHPLLLNNALRDPLGRVGRSLGTVGLDTGSRELGMGRGITGARYWASVLGNGTKIYQEYKSYSIYVAQNSTQKREKEKHMRVEMGQMQNMLQTHCKLFCRAVWHSFSIRPHIQIAQKYGPPC